MISDSNLDGIYLDWLIDQVALLDSLNPARTYKLLVEQMHRIEFFWSVPNDDNRIADGVDLRLEFLNSIGATERDGNFMEVNCSVMEMLVALCRRLAFQSGKDEYFWFRQLLDNIGIGIYNDEAYMRLIDATETIDLAWHEVIHRKYRANGRGGLFPLKHPRKNQKEVEIWYQMSAYLLENNYG